MTLTQNFSQDNTIDPRIVANTLIKSSIDRELNITHISLQKLAYFAHGMFLIRTKKPLVSGFFEAWTYGPVHPAIYAAFKVYEGRPINGLAKRKDLRSGLLFDLPRLENSSACQIIEQTLDRYGPLSTGQLVKLSHARDGPWDIVSREVAKKRSIGLRISNEVILAHFQRHKVFSSELENTGDFCEDTPLANHGFR